MGRCSANVRNITNEIVGRIAGLGPGSIAFALGDRVGVPWLWSTCGTCGYCKRGAENLCDAARFTGYREDGGYAEYAVVPYPLALAHEALGDLEAGRARARRCWSWALRSTHSRSGIVPLEAGGRLFFLYSSLSSSALRAASRSPISR